MALDATVLAAIRGWVGAAAPTDDNLEARYGRLLSVEATALEVLRQRLADLIADPLTFSVAGDASWSYVDNVRFLQEQIGELGRLVPGTPGELTVSLMTRAGARGSR